MDIRRKILVVDDDNEDQQIVLDYFKDGQADQMLEFKKNGKDALAHLDALSDDQLPKLIVLDLNMPILNGTQTLLQIRNSIRYKNIPVIIYSTSENENEKRKCLSFGANDYLVKPSNDEEGQKMFQLFRSFVI